MSAQTHPDRNAEAPDTGPAPTQATPPSAPPPVLAHGDAAEDASAYARLRTELRAHYGVQGPLEALLLDRVATLAWRLARIPTIERGLLTQATLGLSWKRARGRLREARLPDLGLLGHDGAALATNPHRLAQAVHALAALRAKVAAGQPDGAAARPILADVFGTSPDGTLHGTGAALLDALVALRPGMDPAPVLTELDALLGLVEGLQAEAEAEATHSDQAAIDAHLLPSEVTARVLERYERHLQRALLEAVRELERAVARRRLAEVVRRRWGR